jgi:hypothetical protein
LLFSNGFGILKRAEERRECPLLGAHVGNSDVRQFRRFQSRRSESVRPD